MPCFGCHGWANTPNAHADTVACAGGWAQAAAEGLRLETSSPDAVACPGRDRRALTLPVGPANWLSRERTSFLGRRRVGGGFDRLTPPAWQFEHARKLLLAAWFCRCTGMSSLCRRGARLACSSGKRRNPVI